ncbi:hypothetical protein EW146_g9164 [Bondarzewia mesenterica]|uniref:Thioesterase domain-containing protein n=1 Tax=Bondarzewia mesenterica TaxID=1095465 RepID=A0A4V3XD05_9AGAM|nr:hypothetical protein EW146_g9164 [Bondarzewia mesenterica]
MPINPLSLEEAAKLRGNASPEAKQRAANGLYGLIVNGSGFADAVGRRIIVTEVCINKKAEEPQKSEAKVVCEITVNEDMINVAGNIHGGCSAFLVDVCSTLAFAALNESGAMGVSQAINMLYHAPARIFGT